MFSLQKTTATLVDVNPRAEKHGQSNVLAVDLKFDVSLPNDVLSEFHPSLKSALYFKDSNPRPPDDLVTQAKNEEPGWLPNLRFKDLAPVKWKHEIVGGTLTVHAAIARQNDIELNDVHADTFQFDCQEGGTVLITFRAQCHPDEKTIGKLCAYIQESVQISLEPPESAPELPHGNAAEQQPAGAAVS